MRLIPNLKKTLFDSFLESFHFPSCPTFLSMCFKGKRKSAKKHIQKSYSLNSGIAS